MWVNLLISSQVSESHTMRVPSTPTRVTKNVSLQNTLEAVWSSPMVSLAKQSSQLFEDIPVTENIDWPTWLKDLLIMESLGQKGTTCL